MPELKIKDLTEEEVNLILKTREEKREVTASSEEKKLDKIISFLEKMVGGSQRKDSVPVVKQLDQEKMEAIEWLYPVEEDDLHGERMDREEIRKMVENLNKANEEKKLTNAVDHLFKSEGWHLVKAWVNECDCMVGDTFVPEGWPLAKTKFTNPDLWKARKEGNLLGLSIGARGIKEEIE
jgi:hypothetical protein